MQKRQYFWLFGFVAGLAAIGLYIQKWNRQFLKYQMQTKALPTDAGQLHLGKQVQVSTLLECPAEKVMATRANQRINRTLDMALDYLHISWKAGHASVVEGT